MTNLENHYKERTPMETVQIIKNFFEQNGFELKLSDVNESEAGTWYCHLDLRKDNVHIGNSNGKGMTKEFALASGYAELYERFCNQMNFAPNTFWARDLIKANKEKHGYYFSPEEKLMSHDELLNASKRAKDYFDFMCDNNPEIIQATLDFITDKQGIGVPMKNIDNSDVLYMDPRMLMRITRSNGMAAGNTITEALVQGISEIVERDATERVYHNFTTDTFYAINLDKITDKNLITVINNIKNEGYDFYLFDLSYNYNLPVAMSLLINRKNGILNMNFGAFPVFEIAAERVLTELYQGIKSYNNKEFKARLQLPYKAYTLEELARIYGNSIDGELFPADFFENIKYVDEYNKECFIDKNNSNESMLNYYINLSNKTPGMKFYYFDNSLIPEVSAVWVMLENTNEYSTMSACHSSKKITFDVISKAQVLNTLNLIIEVHEQIYNNEPVSMAKFMEVLNILFTSNGPTILFFDFLSLWNLHFIFQNQMEREFFSSLLYNDVNFIADSYCFTPYYFEYKKLIQLRAYVQTGKYTEHELFNIFNKIFDYKITKEDIYNCRSVPYLLQRIYINTQRNYLHSDNYHELINVYVNKQPLTT